MFLNAKKKYFHLLLLFQGFTQNKYLGILIDDSLSFTPHILQLVNKLPPLGVGVGQFVLQDQVSLFL